MTDVNPTETQALLEAWRASINFESLTWRDEPPAEFANRAQRIEQKRRERSWRDRRAFGENTWGASASHREAKTREDMLKANGLPVIRSEFELAKWLGLTLGRLRYFTHDNPTDKVWHYVKYTIPKRSGGERVILAPKAQLKALQRKILHEILEKVKPHHAAHGFVRGRSIVSHAAHHVGKRYVMRIDLKDFFPTITFARVRGLFILWGYSFSVASTMALLCTEYDRVLFERPTERHWVATGPRILVQGAPTSPALANLVVWKLDLQLRRLAGMRHCSYTRYADDFTFSGDKLETLKYILGETQRVVQQEGFNINPDKTRIMRRSNRQVVTGLVVNDKTSVPRAVRRQLRAILHNAGHTGLDAQNRDNRPDFRAYLQGMIGFIRETNPVEAGRFAEELAVLEFLRATGRGNENLT